MYKRLRGFCVIFSFLFISGFCYAKDKILIEEFESYQKKKNKSVDMTKLYLKSISKLKVKKALAKIKSECKWNNNLVNKYDWEIIEFGDYKTPVDDDEIINLELIKRAHDYWISTLKDDDLLENLGILDDEDDEEEDEEDFELESNKSYPIKWIVLEKNDEDMLLCSLYPIDWRTFSGSYKSYNDHHEQIKLNEYTYITKDILYSEKQIVTWETCDLRKWLNNEFYDKAFSEDEKARIKSCSIKNSPNPKYGTYCGRDTSDKVFLLSAEEFIKFFPTLEMKQLPSKLKDMYMKKNNNEYMINIYKEGSVTHLKNLSFSQTSHSDFEDVLGLIGEKGNLKFKSNEYWLRTMGGGDKIDSNDNNVVTVDYSGEIGSKPSDADYGIDYDGTYFDGKCAVRPVIRVKIRK